MKQCMILDGAMGTMLQQAGLAPGERPEIFGLQNPDVLEAVQRQYVEAGSDVIYANTFGANAHKLKGTGYTVSQLIEANVAVAKRAAAGKAKVALDIGPIGELMEPMGELSFEDAYTIFREMIEAGVKAGAELVVFETMSDLCEVKAGVLAAKECSDLPVWVTMSFEATGRTFMGTLVSTMAATLDGLGVDAMGINCSLGPKEILPMIQNMGEWTTKPLIAKPNAGLPNTVTGGYDIDAETFAAQMEPFLTYGISMGGGCCGTTPAFIKALAEAAEKADGAEASRAGGEAKQGVCTPRLMVEYTDETEVLPLVKEGEEEDFVQALQDDDLDYVVDCAMEQLDDGAEVLEIYIGYDGVDEAGQMAAVVQAIQEVVNVPFRFKTADAAALEAGLRTSVGRAAVNLAGLSEEDKSTLAPIIAKYGALVTQ